MHEQQTIRRGGTSQIQTEVSTLYLIYMPLYWVYRVLVPPWNERQVLTWLTIPLAFAYIIPFLFMAYLVRRADTHLIRLLLLPTVASSVVFCTFRYKIAAPYYYNVECVRVMTMLITLSKTLDFAFAKNGRFKEGEKKLRSVNEPTPSPMDENSLQHTSARIIPPFPPWLGDALEVSFAMRGIGWDFGRGLRLPRFSRPTERAAFLRATAVSLLKSYLIVDACDSFLKSVPGVGSTEGGSLFLPDLSFPLRYVVSTLIHITWGTMIITGADIFNDIPALIGVGLLGHRPTSWPPMQENPWRATSLREFWGERWHQALRHLFLIFGGYPGRWIAGNVGMMLGTFFTSGVYHEIGCQNADHRVTLFFLLQATCIMLEEGYKKMTKQKVGGLMGWGWTVLCVIGLGQMCTDAWCRQGIAGAVIVPRSASIVRRIVLPTIQYFVRPVS